MNTNLRFNRERYMSDNLFFVMKQTGKPLESSVRKVRRKRRKISAFASTQPQQFVTLSPVEKVSLVVKKSY